MPCEANSEHVVGFLVAMASEGRNGGSKPLSLNTLRLYRSGLNDQWRMLGLPSPASETVVDEVLRGLARLRRDTPRRIKALRECQILEMMDFCGNSLYGLRDAAILSLGFAAALRRSELCNLRTDDLEQKSAEGILVHVRRFKTDAQGIGQKVAVIEGKAVKPVSRVNQWLKASDINRGYVFQTLLRGGIASGCPLDSGDVARIVKRYVRKIGLDPNEYSGHSLRVGFVTKCGSSSR